MKALLGKLLFAIIIVVVGTGARGWAQTSPTLFFLKVDGINGESNVAGHENEIDVFSFKLGVKQKAVTDFGGGAGAAKSLFLPVVVHKNVDVSSPALFLACATGLHIKKVELFAAKSGSGGPVEDYLVITLTDVIVSSLNHESAEDDGTTTVLESLSLNYAKIEISYRKREPNGSLGAPVKAGYDVKANKKL